MRNQILMSLLFMSFSVNAFAQGAGETVKEVYSHSILNVPGKKMTGILVSYAPGAKSPSHRHGQAFIVAYVIEGSVRSKVEGGEEKVYKVGESWTEKPGDYHVISENASKTAPAKILAVFIVDEKQKDMVVFDK